MRLRHILDFAEAGDTHWSPRNDIRTIAEWRDSGGVWKPIYHENLAICSSDIDISLAWGAVVDDRPFDSPWTSKFSYGAGPRCRVALRYRGAVVWDWDFLWVDRYECLIPVPNEEPRIAPAVFSMGLAMFMLSRRADSKYDSLQQVLDTAGISY